VSQEIPYELAHTVIPQKLVDATSFTVPTVEQGRSALTDFTNGLPPTDELIVLCMILCVLWAVIPPLVRFVWSSMLTAVKTVMGLAALALTAVLVMKWMGTTGAAPF
jgi:hypothetical protein